MLNDLQESLVAYVKGRRSIADCMQALAEVDWNDPSLANDDQEQVALLELLCTEVTEGMREEREFLDEVQAFLEKSSPTHIRNQ